MKKPHRLIVVSILLAVIFGVLESANGNSSACAWAFSAAVAYTMVLWLYMHLWEALEREMEFMDEWEQANEPLKQSLDNQREQPPHGGNKGVAP